MNNDEKIYKTLCKQLIDGNFFNKDLANAFVRARGRCEYCGSDLLMSRQGYAISEIDHLLPRSTFLKLESEPNNHVLCCRTCNGVKSTFNPLEESGIKDHKVAKQMLEGKERSELMDRARAKIAERMEEHDKVWREVTEILRDVWWKGVPHNI